MVSRVITGSRSVVVQKPVDHPDVLLVLFLPVEHVCHSLQHLQQVFGRW